MLLKALSAFSEPAERRCCQANFGEPADGLLCTIGLILSNENRYLGIRNILSDILNSRFCFQCSTQWSYPKWLQSQRSRCKTHPNPKSALLKVTQLSKGNFHIYFRIQFKVQGKIGVGNFSDLVLLFTIYCYLKRIKQISIQFKVQIT